MIKQLILSLTLSLLFFNVSLADENFTHRPEVQTFIHQMVKKHHFKEKALISLFDQVKVRPKVIQSVKKPLESNPWYRYQRLFVTEWRIREGVNFWNTYHDALLRAEKEYGVPASIIVATIGVETKYGRNTGNYRVIDALSNLAFGDTPRAPYFKKELEEFLLLTREKHLNPTEVMGSYAGAIGQPQFMPSSYRYYAVNFSGNKHIDLSHNEIDVIGSIANYYQKHGWRKEEPVVMPAKVTLSYRFKKWFTKQKPITIEDFSKMGVYPINNNAYPDDRAKLLTLQGYYRSEYWLSFHNFDVIKRYNTSDLYAMAVYQLSEYISEVRERTNG